ncbi:MICOS complex subunit MIC26-like [Periophthalmus magnuspinnatus]|uniref:MICOS complex subunit MIC26-like n=1 Tax=Periophthalmus magnuspinnatus TaxID=409849 RepID=UPI00145ACB07|nr:MICOS complex subunit MIC26-like [Periophthalmus magnuspinnatus]
MPRVFSLFALPVLSAADTEEKEPVSSLNRDELSLYTAPEQNSNFIQPQPGQLEETVASVRRSVEPCISWCQGTYSKIKPKIQHGVQVGKDVYTYLSNPPNDFYPKAGVIWFTGILGLFLARRSRIKRFVYPAGLMTLSASMYYPEKAANIAKMTGDKVYAGAVQSYAAVEKMFKTEEKPKKETEKENKP